MGMPKTGHTPGGMAERLTTNFVGGLPPLVGKSDLVVSGVPDQLPPAVDVPETADPENTGKIRNDSHNASETGSAGRGGYRPVPANFRERFPQIGWGGARAEWRTSAAIIRRWVHECGYEEMVLARLAHRNEVRDVRDRAMRKRYVLGLTLRPVGRDVVAAPSTEVK